MAFSLQRANHLSEKSTVAVPTIPPSYRQPNSGIPFSVHAMTPIPIPQDEEVECQQKDLQNLTYSICEALEGERYEHAKRLSTILRNMPDNEWHVGLQRVKAEIITWQITNTLNDLSEIEDPVMDSVREDLNAVLKRLDPESTINSNHHGQQNSQPVPHGAGDGPAQEEKLSPASGFLSDCMNGYSFDPTALSGSGNVTHFSASTMAFTMPPTFL
jgi:hypothetical protein